MDFVKPEFSLIYTKISTNNKLIKFLTDIGALLTTDDFYEQFGPNSKLDSKIYISKYNGEVLSKLADLFLEHDKAILEHSIDYLIAHPVNKVDLCREIKIIFGFSEFEDINPMIFRELFYCYKNSYLENFFQNNWRTFLPDIDVEELTNNDIATSFLDAIAIEFDKINEIISDVNKFHDYNEIPAEYINHLSQLLGIEQKTFMLGNDKLEQFRILSANIIEIYKQKGTFAAFQLMFKLLGFKVNIYEYYFDRRYYFSAEDQNIETDTSDKTSYRYYLTKNNPTFNKSSYFEINEVVSDKDMTERYNLQEFNELVSKYGIMCVLGFDDYYTVKEKIMVDGAETFVNKSYKYTGHVYKYFKTNYIKLIPAVYGQIKNLTVKQIVTIRKILEFLTPYFWNVNILVNPITDFGGDGANEESMTLNGHRGMHLEDEDMYPKNDEGFRMLDSETWIYRNEDEVYSSEEKEFDEFEIRRLNKIKKDYLLETIDDYIVTKKDSTIFSEDELISRAEANGETVEEYCERLKFTETTNGEKKYYIRDITQTKYNVNDILYKNEPNDTYYNSVGERKGSRPYNKNGAATEYNVIMEPIGKKINIINSTKYWGKVKDINSKSSDALYPIWIQDYEPITSGNGDRKYFVPGEVGLNHIYIPKYSSLDTEHSWANLKQVDLNGLEGDTLKKYFLNAKINNKKENKEIKWVLPENLTLKEFLTLEDKTGLQGEISKFFETQTSTSPNLTWNVTNMFVTKDTLSYIEQEDEIITILNESGIKVNNICDINNEVIGLLSELSFTGLNNQYYKQKLENKGIFVYKVPTNIIINKLREYINNNEIKKYPVLCDFIKNHKVANYNYIDNVVYSKKLQSLTFENNNETYCVSDDLINGLYSQDIYYLEEVEKNDICNLQSKTIKAPANGFIVYRLSKNKNHNKLWFMPTKIFAASKFEVNSFSELNYADSENEVNEQSRLFIRDDGKTYFYYEKNGTSFFEEIHLGDIISVKNEFNDDGRYRKYIATVGIDGYKSVSSNSEVLKLNCVNNNATLNNIGDFYYKRDKTHDSYYDKIAFDVVYDDESRVDYNLNCPIDDLAYVMELDELDEHHRLIFIKGKTYLYNLEQKELYKHALAPGIIIKTNDDRIFKVVKTPNPISDDDIKEFRTNSLIQKKYVNIHQGDLIYSPKENTIFEIIFNSICAKRITDTLYTQEEVDSINVSINNYDGNTITYAEDDKNNYSFSSTEITYTKNDYNDVCIFGIKPYVLKGSLIFDEGKYKVETHDLYYKGISEDEDNDNYILNNNERIIKWNIFNGCEDLGGIQDYNNIVIKRPVRRDTDIIFDTINEKNNNKVVKNILNELIGDQSFLRASEVIK